MANQVFEVFWPEQVRQMLEALDRSWRSLELIFRNELAPSEAQHVRELLAKRIIVIAGRGETDPTVMSDQALSYLPARFRVGAKTVRRRRRTMAVGPKAKAAGLKTKAADPKKVADRRSGASKTNKWRGRRDPSARSSNQGGEVVNIWRKRPAQPDNALKTVIRKDYLPFPTRH
jgi:hypothetical protein